MNALVPGLALTLLAVAAPPAAATDYRMIGGCGWRAVQNAFPPGSWGEEGYYTGEVDLSVVLVGAGGDTVEADVSCLLVVEGEAPREVLAPVHVTTAGVAGPRRITYVKPAPDAYVGVCTVVDFADHRSDVTDCPAYTGAEVPPGAVKDVGWTVTRPAEAATCAAVGAHAPGTGGVDIAPEGDVYAGDEWVLDCPPYANPRP